MKINMVSRIGYKDIFNTSANIDTFLKHIDIEESLEFFVILNTLGEKVHGDDLSELNFIRNNWLTNSNANLKQKIVDCYLKIINKKRNYGDFNLNSVNIINKAATLRAIEILISKSFIASKTQKPQNSEENLFLFYLTVNDEIASREDKLFTTWRNNDKADNIRFHLYLGLNQSSSNPESASKKLWTEIIKFVQFEKWIRHQQKYKEFAINYLKQFGVTTWYELITLIFYINSMAINNIRFSKDIDVQYWKLLSYFADHKQSNIDWNELTEIKKHPLFKLKDGDYLIIDLFYLMDKFFTGIYHDMIAFSKNSNTNKFHQDYSKHFIEEILLVNAIKSVFGKNYLQFSEEEIKEYGKKGIENLALPDYYIRNGNKVFIFECKNSYLSNKFKVESNYEAIEADIIEKFYCSSTKRKAIQQLANFIDLSQSSNYYFFDKGAKLKNIKYYPILIITDSTLNSLGFNNLFNEYFSKEMMTRSKTISEKVKPLTIINIDDLFYRANYLKDLDKGIDEYQNYCTKNRAIESMISFTDYLDMHKFKKNQVINEKMIKEIMKDSVFPDS